jgi:hypothetical protein
VIQGPVAFERPAALDHEVDSACVGKGEDLDVGVCRHPRREFLPGLKTHFLVPQIVGDGDTVAGKKKLQRPATGAQLRRIGPTKQLRVVQPRLGRDIGRAMAVGRGKREACV